MNIDEYIKSGILEVYVLGMASDVERLEIEALSRQHLQVKQEIERLQSDMEALAAIHQADPGPLARHLLMATIDFTERLKKGEQLKDVPPLHKDSKPKDYSLWLSREDLRAPEKIDGIFVKLIGYTPELTSAILWITDSTPPEVHSDEHERFLIIEGECDIFVGDEKKHLVPGDYFEIPLHKNHTVKVTSLVPCKAILQRAAA